MWAYILQFGVVTALLGKAEFEEVILFLSVGFFVAANACNISYIEKQTSFPRYNHSISLISAPIFQAT